MATLKDYRDERLRKLTKIKELGINPYPAKTVITHNLKDITDQFKQLEQKIVSVAGRVLAIRKFGKLAFIKIRDDSGEIQIFIKDAENTRKIDRENSELNMPEEIALLDTGDFVNVTGQVIKTQTGEISVTCDSLRLLTKALRPLPSRQEGFSDKEQRFRRRYVDMNVNLEVKERFKRRSNFWKAVRNYLDERGFYEVNIPVLEHTTGGADANPFVTHMDSLGQDFYLRISHELPLKRLIGAGFEKVYDIGPRFRNEGLTDEHLPEHIAMEWYWAYANWEQGMALMEDLFGYVLNQTFGTLKFDVKGHHVDFSKKWESIDYQGIIMQNFGIDVYNCTIEEIKKALKQNKIEVEKSDNIPRGIDKLWKKLRVDIAGPAWLINTPKFISPLAKTNLENPNMTQRFQAVIAGSELCNGYSELNDPIDQLSRFLEQQGLRDQGDDEAQMLDIDFVEMLEYGLPPTCGLGFSERVFWIFEGVTAKEGVPFPHMKYEVDEVTKSLYSDVDLMSHKQQTPKLRSDDSIIKPISAVEEGTKKLYLDDYSTLTSESIVNETETDEDGSLILILDQTCAYPGGGGQACDLGLIKWNGGVLNITKITKDEEGIIRHIGLLEGKQAQIGEKVSVSVDSVRRKLNSRLHCVGHLIDKAVFDIGLTDWRSGRSAHYPEMSFVEYTAKNLEINQDEVIPAINLQLALYAKSGGQISVTRVPSEQAHQYSKYIPTQILEKYQNVHIAQYPDNFNICCGGTHLNDVSEIGGCEVTKIKVKSGIIKVSYIVK